MSDPPGVMSPRSRWTERAVILFAAAASIATSPPRWRLTAPIPAVGGVTGKALLVSVEASHRPDVGIMDAASVWRIAGPEGAAASWTGGAVYLVPPGWKLNEVSIGERCTGGGPCSDCKPPPGAFVRIASLDPIDPWTISAVSKPVGAVLDPTMTGPAYRVTVESTRPAMLQISTTPPGVTPPSVGPPSVVASSSTMRTYDIDWSVPTTTPAAPLPFTWTVRATILGVCGGTGAGPCPPPAGEAVRVVSVDVR